jgi:hypothetical protein
MSASLGPNIGIEEMRNFVIQALRYFDQQSDHTNNYPDKKVINNLRARVEDMIYRKYNDSFPRYSNNTVDYRMNEYNRNSFLEVVHSLLVEGVIMWGNAFDRDAIEFPNYSITTYGKEVLKAGDITPHDPDHYLVNLKSMIPKLDDIVLLYLQESLQCFLRGNYIASSVMLGVASEATFYQLFNWLLNNAIDSQFKSSLSNIQNRNDLKGKFNLVYNELMKRKNQFDSEVRDNMETNLRGIFHFIRLQRNDTGHPTGKLVGRDQMFINLNIFPSYCETVYAIVKKLKKTKNML